MPDADPQADQPDISVGQAVGALAGAAKGGIASLWNRTRPALGVGAGLVGTGATGVYRYLLTDTPVHKFNETLQIRRNTASEFNDAVEHLEEAHSDAVAKLDELGRLEIEVMDNQIRRFVRAFERVKNVELIELDANGTPARDDVPQLNLDDFDFGAVDAGRALIAGGGSAAIVGAASWAAVTGLAAASTGTAISSLSGAAATNAALAWFGGGSIASGGLGMSAGAVVLGGIAAAPAILAGGFILDRKAAAEREGAHTAAAEAALQVETIRLEQRAAEAVGASAANLHTTLRRLQAVLLGEVAFTELLVARETDYRAYNAEERGRLMTTTNLVKLTKDVMDVPLFDEAGALSDESADVIAYAETALQDVAP